VRFSNRTYLQGAGECLPFEDETFDRVVSAFALPYMNIQKTLAEIHRVLVPGDRLSLGLHLPSFTMAELLHNAIPKTSSHTLSAICIGKWVIVPTVRQDCRVPKGEDGIFSDRARNGGRTESRWIR
jgi:ubiquinone/menaquinone biosynthesis C-methylase UbiE